MAELTLRITNDLQPKAECAFVQTIIAENRGQKDPVNRWSLYEVGADESMIRGLEVAIFDNLRKQVDYRVTVLCFDKAMCLITCSSVVLQINEERATHTIVLASDITSKTLASGIQKGIADAEASSEQVKIVSFKFTRPFTSDEIGLIVTPVNEQENFNDEFIVTVKKITASGATVIIRRMDAPTGWGQNLKLHWMAWE